MDEHAEVTAFSLYAKKLPLLKKEEEFALAVIVQAKGPGAAEAKRKMLLHNLLLVVSIAYNRRPLSKFLTVMDLVQEGIFGLDRAIDKFDPTRGFRFSTYASWWIRQHMNRAIQNNNNGIRIPVFVQEEKKKVRDAVTVLTDRFGRDPTEREIANFLDVPVGTVHKIRNISRVDGSLDDVVPGTERATLDEAIPDLNTVSSETVTGVRTVCEMFPELMSVLDDRSRDMLFLRHADEPWSLEDIGIKYSMTREGVRQHLIKIRRKLHKRAAELDIDCYWFNE